MPLDPLRIYPVCTGGKRAAPPEDWGGAWAYLRLVDRHHVPLAAHQASEPWLAQPHYLSLLAEAYGQAGQPKTGLQVLAEALTLVAVTEERWWEAELYQLKWELLLQLSTPDVYQAETCLQQALAVARCQQAKSLESRAAMSLARLWQQQDQREAARNLLVPIYSWFTEGLDTPDLQETKRLWEELA